MAIALTRPQDARRTYSTLCTTLDNMKWTYQPDDEKMVINTSAVGEDLTIKLRIVVSEDRGLMYVKSPMPYKVPENAREIVGTAVNVANFSMLNGCFEYDKNDGYLAFKIVVPFDGCVISEQVCHYMIVLACQMTDKFNDKFLAVAKGNMRLADFEAFANK
ncbi:MAG: YbjN domain-containing protein [Corallococcus sp.]|nr:YbjN domain-containing protein [Corallococcus sp.]MCM1359946.1 YbjN domain-containing protein [Corallococcus sp.]MCM1395502.1 YbjN domain-containing protein [Corallococcus sp.]